ncbi:hypothetical protein SS05631_a49130 (plasmid) [Sinorhizobium sp. CCBAU 05631]|nr:hypothetical protein SS05631_a49130 [Sinorhizobium sp. CCBAU 05631]
MHSAAIAIAATFSARAGALTINSAQGGGRARCGSRRCVWL